MDRTPTARPHSAAIPFLATTEPAKEPAAFMPLGALHSTNASRASLPGNPAIFIPRVSTSSLILCYVFSSSVTSSMLSRTEKRFLGFEVCAPRCSVTQTQVQLLELLHSRSCVVLRQHQILHTLDRMPLFPCASGCAPAPLSSSTATTHWAPTGKLRFKPRVELWKDFLIDVWHRRNGLQRPSVHSLAFTCRSRH